MVDIFVSVLLVDPRKKQTWEIVSPGNYLREGTYLFFEICLVCFWFEGCQPPMFWLGDVFLGSYVLVWGSHVLTSTLFNFTCFVPLSCSFPLLSLWSLFTPHQKHPHSSLHLTSLVFDIPSFRVKVSLPLKIRLPSFCDWLHLCSIFTSLFVCAHGSEFLVDDCNRV
jgi:hypothetical protein